MGLNAISMRQLIPASATPHPPSDACTSSDAAPCPRSRASAGSGTASTSTTYRSARLRIIVPTLFSAWEEGTLNQGDTFACNRGCVRLEDGRQEVAVRPGRAQGDLVPALTGGAGGQPHHRLLGGRAGSPVGDLGAAGEVAKTGQRASLERGEPELGVALDPQRRLCGAVG